MLKASPSPSLTTPRVMELPLAALTLRESLLRLKSKASLSSVPKPVMVSVSPVPRLAALISTVTAWSETSSGFGMRLPSASLDGVSVLSVPLPGVTGSLGVASKALETTRSLKSMVAPLSRVMARRQWRRRSRRWGSPEAPCRRPEHRCSSCAGTQRPCQPLRSWADGRPWAVITVLYLSCRGCSGIRRGRITCCMPGSFGHDLL